MSPHTVTEEVLKELWRRVLRAPGIRADADFFELGGDSFRAVQLASLIQERFGVEAGPSLIFERPVLAGQTKWIVAQGSTRNECPAAGPSGRADGVALSTQQEDFLLWCAESADVRDPGGVVVAVRIVEPFDTATFRRALSELTHRHEALRTRISPAGVVIDESTEPEIVTVEATDDEVLDAALAFRSTPFDLEKGPLFRALIAAVGPDDHVLVLAVHHFVFDGWSMGVLLRELGILYSAFRAGRDSPLKPQPLTYADYCAWTRGQWARTEPYWTANLAGAPRALTARGTSRFTRASYAFTIDAATGDALCRAARRVGATPFMAMAACWSALLAQWTGGDDIVLMSPVPGRTRPEHEQLIGCLVQSLHLRIDLSGAPTYPELFDRVREAVLGATEHQFHAYHDTRRAVPFPARLHYEAWGAVANLPGLLSEPFDLPREQPFPTGWTMPPGETDHTAPALVIDQHRDGALNAALVYNGDLYPASEIAGLAEDLRRHIVAAGA